MAEMYCQDVKYGWLGMIFAVMERCPQHIFQSLTKQPDSVIPKLPENLHFGVSVTGLGDEWRLTSLTDHEASVYFASFEPLLGPVKIDKYAMEISDLDWMIIGKLTGAGKHQHFERVWVTNLLDFADEFGIPVFMKNNLTVPSYPPTSFFKKEELRQEFPNVGDPAK